MLSVIVAVSTLNSVYAQENMTDLDIPEFFAIQHAQSGSLSQINETTYSLVLKALLR